MPCTFHLCHEPAGWTVSGRPHCRAHMLDAVLATGFGTVTAVRIAPEPEPQADIVERLRRWTHAAAAPPASDLLDEAADEIERLREELAEAVAAGMAALEALRRERDRLRIET